MNLDEAAERLGVHYMTVYRYVRLGRLAAEQRGGRWYVAAEDVDALHSNRPGPSSDDQAAWPARSARLLSQMLAGDAAGSWGIVESSLMAAKPADVHLKLLGPVMRELGASWARGEVSIADEHRATAVALGLVGRLGPLFTRRGRRRPGSVVLGGAQGDTHVIPLTMVADQLRSEGWNVVDLGANVPATALAEVAGDCEDLVAVGISMCADEHATRVTDSIEAVRRAKSLVPVLLGGPAVPSLEAARHLGADEWAADSSGVAKIMSRIAGNRR